MTDSAEKKKSETNIKDTIESILVAFILAFIFRCFVVEAFVIPTGSMAPTLMGAHMDFRCPDCGYSFSVGYDTNGDATFSIPSNHPGEVRVHCPNCGYQLPRELPGDPDNQGVHPPLKYGDRILVMKYLYLFHEPERWDVVVFKSPMTSREAPDYSVNYIKRLIGKPGESLVVCNGDVFVAPPGANGDEPASYKVQTKPAHVQSALWRIIFDADFVPQSARGGMLARGAGDGWSQPWHASGSGWVNDDPAKNLSPRQFRFENPTGSGALKLNPTWPNGFQDWLAYNQPADGLARRNVGDLKLEFFLSDLEGDGVVRAILHKQTEDHSGVKEFAAELSKDGVKLVMRTKSAETVIAEKVIGEKQMDLRGVHHVSLQNVDYRVELSIDDKPISATSEADYAPDVPTLVRYAAKPPAGGARLEGDRVKAQVEHLRVWRDIYYREDGGGGIQTAFADQSRFQPMKLKEKEFFVLGDNSAKSLDGRFWNNEIKLEDEDLDVRAGIVPERFMLGKAFFVYWPAGYKAFGSGPGLVPNFGQMRFIR